MKKRMPELASLSPFSWRLPRPLRRARLAQWGVVLVVCWLLAWWWSGVLSTQRVVEDLGMQGREVEIETSMLTAHLSDRLSQAQSVAAILAQDPGVRQAVLSFGAGVRPTQLPLPEVCARWSGDADLAVLTERFARVLPAFRLKVLWVTNAAGDVVAEAHAAGMQPVLGMNFADRAYFKSARQGLPGHQFAVGRLTNMMGLYFSAPILHNGKFMGMVGSSISIEEFESLMQEAWAFVTDEFGVVVLAPDPSWLFRQVPTATVNSLAEAERQSRYKRTVFEPLDTSPTLAELGVPLYTVASLPGPVLQSSRQVQGGYLTVHNIRSQTRLLAERRVDRLWSFAAMGGAASLGLMMLGGVYLFAEVTARQNRALGRLNARLSRQANTDALTGAHSRRHFLQAMALELVRSQRHGLDVCVLSLDLDHFKHVNDTHGHAGGDAVLKHFAQLIQAELRQTDVFGRVGGEEFAIVLAQTTAQGGRQMAERIRASVERSPVNWEGHPIAVTVSIGGTHWHADRLPKVDHVLAASDRVLYQAKHEGRNRVVWGKGTEVAATPPAGDRAEPTASDHAT